MNKRNTIWQEIEMEVRSSKKTDPNWPDHAAAQAGLVVKESGDLMSAALRLKYKDGPTPAAKEDMRKEAIQTAAMAIRFLENLR